MTQSGTIDDRSLHGIRKYLVLAGGLRLKAIACAAFLAPLLTRLVIGQTYFLTGRGKLMNFEKTTDFFASLALSMVVALFTADRQSFIDAIFGDLTGVAPVPLLLFLIWLAANGAGTISLDRLVTWWIGRANRKSLIGKSQPNSAPMNGTGPMTA